MVTITIIVTAIVTIIVSNGNNYTTKMALLAAFVSIKGIVHNFFIFGQISYFE